MILYHTSDTIIEKPDIFHSRDFLDFGKGFYMTHLRGQAEKYGERFIRRGRNAWLNIYEVNLTQNIDCKLLRFEKYDKDWLNFVSKCRGGLDNTDYDIIIGGIANDKVIRTLDRYFNREINEDEALGLLIYEQPNIQYCIRSQKVLDQDVKFIEGVKL